uniref:SNF2 domain-containing protein CLASSY 4-like n=1 Tax=Erigeron canadensis TaxID=72917 RepID=UPI001CB992B1|nr:SNF2 domain-containing protein CLASSY 4-like [Erigeron canadensis]
MDFSKTTLYQRTRSCYDKFYLEYNEKKGNKRIRKRDGNREEEEKTGKSSEGLNKGKSEIDGGGSGKKKRGIKRKKDLGKVSNKVINDSEIEDEDYDDDKEFVVEDKKVKRGQSSKSFENVSQISLIDELDDDDVKLSKKNERKQSKSDVERVSGSGKSKNKFVKDSGADRNYKGARETLKVVRKSTRTNDAQLRSDDVMTKSFGRNDKKDADLGFSGREIDESDDEEGVSYLGDNLACLDDYDPSFSSRVESNEVKVSPVVELDSIRVDVDGGGSQSLKLSEEKKVNSQRVESTEDAAVAEDVTIISLSSSSDYVDDEDQSSIDGGDSRIQNVPNIVDWTEVSVKRILSEDYERTKNKKANVFETRITKKRNGSGIDMWKAMEGGLKRRRTDNDTFVHSVDEMGNQEAGARTVTKYDQFGNKVDVAKIFTDSLREDGDGGDMVLRSYMISKEEPLECSPFKETPVEKVCSYKFRFEDEDDIEPKKSESEIEVDELFKEMGESLQSLEIGCSSTTVVNCGDADSMVEGKDQTTCCRRGKHRLTINDQFGIICRCCSYVEMEVRDILPPLSKNGKGGHGRPEYDHDRTDSMKFSDLPAADCYDDSHHEARWSNYDEGTVWDLVPGVKESMYPHQREGFEFIWNKIAGSTYIDKLEKCLTNDGSGCIISHAPGTGKSRLTIVFLQAFLKMYPDARPLIIAPRSMLLTWEEEFKKWDVDFPFYNVNSNECSGQEDAVALSVLKQFGNVRSIHCNRLLKLYSWKKNSSVLGITYRLFESLAGEEGKRKKASNSDDEQIKKILLQVPSLLVLDEGHTPRNDTSLMWKALLNVKTKRSIILSGTPFQNNFAELYNTLCLVNPLLSYGLSSLRSDMFSKKRGWKNNLARGQWDSITSSSKWSQHSIHEIKAVIDPFVHVHKGTILQERLPGLRDALVVLKPTRTQQTLLGKMYGKKRNLEHDHVMSLVAVHPSLLPANSLGNEGFLKMLKVFENDPSAGVKTNFLMELIKLSGAHNEKVLVFCQFIKPLDFIKELLKTNFSWVEGRDFLYMDGQQEEKLRQNSINTLNDPKSEVKLLLASMKACSEGINLVGASRVVLLDVHWNPSVERQAISRAYRLGQKKVVYVYHLVTGSMEGEKYIRQVEKSHLSELVFSSKNRDSSIPKISSTVSEDRILEEMVQHEKLRDMFEKVIYQPKEADLFDTFG